MAMALSLIWQTGEARIGPATPGLQIKRFIHYTTAAPLEAKYRKKTDTRMRESCCIFH